MSVSSRLSSLERKHGGLGDECRCDGGKQALLYCRNPSVTPPPQDRCPRCGRAVPRVIIGKPAPLPGEEDDDSPAYQRFAGLLEYYVGTVRRVPAYEAIGPDGLRALAYGGEPA
jgi:hypothetical protein